MSLDLVPRTYWLPAERGAISFDCVNGRNVGLPVGWMMRRLDRVCLWWTPTGAIPARPPREPTAICWHPFRGAMRRRGILSLFGPDGTVLSEDIVRVLSVRVMPQFPGELGAIRATCYRYHPRSARA